MLTTEDIVGNAERVSVSYKEMPSDLKTGDTVLVDDGLIELCITEIRGTDMVCRIVNGGELGERKGINLPNVSVKLPAITEKG